MSRNLKEDYGLRVCEWIYGGDKGFFLMAAHIPGVDGNDGTGWSGKVVCSVTKWCWETIYVCINTWSLRHLTSAEEYPDEEYLDMSKSSSLKYKRDQQLWVGQWILDCGCLDNRAKVVLLKILNCPNTKHDSKADTGLCSVQTHWPCLNMAQKQNRTTLCRGCTRESKKADDSK